MTTPPTPPPPDAPASTKGCLLLVLIFVGTIFVAYGVVRLFQGGPGP